MNRSVLAFILITFMCLVVLSQPRAAAQVGKRISINVSGQAFGHLAAELMQNEKMILGFEESTLDKDHRDFDFDVNMPFSPKKEYASPFGEGTMTIEVIREFTSETKPISISLTDRPISELFDTLVKQMGDYSWEESYGVINIFPKKHRDRRIEKLMGLRIKEFQVTQEFSLSDLARKLTRLPEVNLFLTENNLHWRSSQLGATIRLEAQYGRPLGKDLSFRDLTFKELLNKISLAKGGGWKVRRSHIFGSKTKEFLEIDI